MSIEINAALNCELNGRKFIVRSSDQRVLVDVPDVQTGVSLLRDGNLKFSNATLLRTVSAVCRRTSTTIELRTANEKLCAVGPDSSVWWLRIWGMSNVFISPRFLLFNLRRQFGF